MWRRSWPSWLRTMRAGSPATPSTSTAAQGSEPPRPPAMPLSVWPVHRSARILALAPHREHAPELLLQPRAHLIRRLRVVSDGGLEGSVVPAEHREIEPDALLAVRLLRLLEGVVAAPLRRRVVAALLRDR